MHSKNSLEELAKRYEEFLAYRTNGYPLKEEQRQQIHNKFANKSLQELNDLAQQMIR